MNEKVNKREQASKLTVLVLVLGLVVGAVGGYFATSATLQPQIDDYESQVLVLKSEVSGLTATVSSLEEDVEDYELQVSRLTQEQTINERTIDRLAGQVVGLEGELKWANENIHLLADRVESLKDAIDYLQEENLSLEVEIDRLEAVLEGKVDTFAIYGFSFDYPAGWVETLTEMQGIYGFSFDYPPGWVAGMQGTEATEESGMVTISSSDGDSAWGVGWLTMETFTDLEAKLDLGIDGMISEVLGLETEERLSLYIGEYGLEHFQRYQRGTTYLGVPSYGHDMIFSSWYCEESDYIFLVILVEPKIADSDMFADLLTLMDSFECH